MLATAAWPRFHGRGGSRVRASRATGGIRRCAPVARSPSWTPAIPTSERGTPARAEEDAPEAPKLREEARLAALVATIDAETAIVPAGAVRMTGSGATVANPAFGGLDATAAQNIDS